MTEVKLNGMRRKERKGEELRGVEIAGRGRKGSSKEEGRRKGGKKGELKKRGKIASKGEGGSLKKGRGKREGIIRE